jgi:hypothetical protein
MGCGSACSLHNDATGIFSDGSESANYPDNANCEWMIAPYNAMHIELSFTEFSTQPHKDVVRVFQCTDIHCLDQQQLAELSGTYLTVQTVTSATGYVKVVFISDDTVTYDGFTASWSMVSCVYFLLICIFLPSTFMLLCLPFAA